MTQAEDGYDWEEILERLDVSFGDFPDMATLINRLDQVLGRQASVRQIDITIDTLQIQRQRALDTGFTVARFTRRGFQVTQLRNAIGRFVASTEIRLGEDRTITRRRVGSIAEALRRGAG